MNKQIFYFTVLVLLLIVVFVTIDSIFAMEPGDDINENMVAEPFIERKEVLPIETESPARVWSFKRRDKVVACGVAADMMDIRMSSNSYYATSDDKHVGETTFYHESAEKIETFIESEKTKAAEILSVEPVKTKRGAGQAVLLIKNNSDGGKYYSFFYHLKHGKSVTFYSSSELDVIRGFEKWLVSRR